MRKAAVIVVLLFLAPLAGASYYWVIELSDVKPEHVLALDGSVLVGSNVDFNGNYDVLLFEVSNGEVLESRLYSGPGNDLVEALLPGAVVGTTYSFGLGAGFVMPLDSAPQVRLYRGPLNFGSFRDAVATDGGILVVGNVIYEGFYGRNFDAWVIRLDPAGNVVWSRGYGSEKGFESGNAIAVGRDGRALVLASGEDYTIVFLIDGEGNVIKALEFRENLNDVAAVDDGYIAVGSLRDVDIAVKFDPDLNVEWVVDYSGEGELILWEVAPMGDGYAIGSNVNLIITTSNGSVRKALKLGTYSISDRGDSLALGGFVAENDRARYFLGLIGPDGGPFEPAVVEARFYPLNPVEVELGSREIEVKVESGTFESGDVELTYRKTWELGTPTKPKTESLSPTPGEEGQPTEGEGRTCGPGLLVLLAVLMRRRLS